MCKYGEQHAVVLAEQMVVDRRMECNTESLVTDEGCDVGVLTAGSNTYDTCCAVRERC